MRFHWPKDTVFRRLVLDVEQGGCAHCGAPLHVCDHRIHRIYTLEPIFPSWAPPRASAATPAAEDTPSEERLQRF